MARQHMWAYHNIVRDSIPRRQEHTSDDIRAEQSSVNQLVNH